MVGPDRVDTEALRRMTAALRHRGPDDEGFYAGHYEDGVAVGLGFRRLSKRGRSFGRASSLQVLGA